MLQIASLLLSINLMTTASFANDSEQTHNTGDTMKEYLLVLNSDRSHFESLTDEEKKAQIARYNAWVGGLVEKGQFKNGLGLAAGHYEIQPDANKTVSGPFTEAVEGITGFFQIAAESYEAAIEIAKTCPALQSHEKILVYQVGGAG